MSEPSNLEVTGGGRSNVGHDLWTSSGRARLRRRIYEVIEIGRGEDRASKLFDTFIVMLIVLNIAAFVVETVPSIQSAYGRQLYAFEVFSVGVFSIEYLTRLWTAVEMPFLARLPAWRARLKLASRYDLVIDLLAILPFYLAYFLTIDLRALRALRLLRFLKLSRYSPAMYTLIRVVSNERRALIGAGFLLLTAILFSATLMYYLENEAQPDKFGSVPEAAWWAIATLTTVGYGDVAPVTVFGRFFGGLTMVVGLCILALPVAIISTGFAQELSRRDFVVTWSLMSRVPLLAALDAREVADIMPLLHAHNMPPNIEIVGEGQQGDAMYFIASGKVHLRSPDTSQSFGAGDCFGVLAVLDNEFQPGAFVTTSKCRLLKLHREDFHRLEILHPAVATHIRRAATSSPPLTA